MHSESFAAFANDPMLPGLAELNVEGLRAALATHVDPNLLDVDIRNYSVCHIRYKPRGNMVIGLTAPQSQRPIAIRIYPSGNLRRRLAKAQSYHPHHVFALAQLDALAWVFPGERKLDLRLLADERALGEVLSTHYGFTFEKFTLQRFVPERKYTGRVTGTDSDGTVATHYLKLHYSQHGSYTASVMRELARCFAKGPLRVPTRVAYLPQYKLLLQNALPRQGDACVTDAQLAAALSKFHALPFIGVTLNKKDRSSRRREKTRALLETIYPRWTHRIDQLWSKVDRELARLPGHEVPIHGDVHSGNFFPLTSGQLGVIDFDSFALGEAEDDLCDYFGFKLKLSLRARQPVGPILASFPGFIDAYNCHARHGVTLPRAYTVLAEKLLSERVCRGLARGKLSGESEVAGFINIAESCLLAAQTDAARRVTTQGSQG